MFRFPLSLLALGLLGACVSVPEQRLSDGPLPQHHTIYINAKGLLVDPITKRPVSEGAASAEEVSAAERAYVQDILGNFQRVKTDRPGLQLTIYVHGGLNTLDRAASRSDTFSAAMIKDEHYPVFIGWPSGALSNYRDHLFRLRDGRERPRLGFLTSPFVLVEDAARSLIRIPAAWYNEAALPLGVMKSLYTKEERDYEARARALDQHGFQVVSPAPYTGVGGSFLTVFNPVKLLTAPFVDGLGAGAWNSMLRRTDLVLSRPSAFQGAIDAGHAASAASVFLNLWVESPDFEAVPINLIGHSMGAIVATNIIARHPSLPVATLVFMGAAGRLKDVESVVVPWMLSPQHADARFYSLSLDPYRELAESKYWDSVPRGSLLVWIDGIFGDVNSFLDRTSGSWRNMVIAAADIFPEPIRDRVHLTRFPIGDEAAGPQSHGAFGDYCFWTSEFWNGGSQDLRLFPNCSEAASINP